MRILIPSIIDLSRSAPSRLHNFIKFLSIRHEITAVCLSDWWKAEQVNTKHHYQDFKTVLDSIKINYITSRRISPILQELFSPVLLKIPAGGFDVIFNYNSLISGHYLARKLRLPMVYDLADDLPAMIASSPQIPGILRPFGRRAGEIMLGRNIAISRKLTVTSVSLQKTYSLPQNKFELLPNGVDTQLFNPTYNGLRQTLGLNNSFVIGYVGVLREWVDFEPVFQSIQDLANVKLLIVGEEGRLNENKELARQTGVEDKVIFAGTVAYQKVPEYVSAMDVCLMPFKQNGITQNSVPLKLFEYMACQKPVISTPLTAVKLAVSDRVAYAADAAEFKLRILELSSNLELRQKLGAEGRQFVLENYTWSKVCAKLEEILLETAQTQKGLVQ